MCLYIEVLAPLTSESGISFFWVGVEGGGWGVGWTMGNETFYWYGLTLSTVFMQDLLQFSPVTMEYARLFFSNF